MTDATITPEMAAALLGLAEAAEQGQPARDAELQRRYAADRDRARALTRERYARSAT
jgi:hypothetical protein